MRSTGVPGLDIPLDGGFPYGTVIVVKGNPLSGLDHLARQFWSANGEAGTYLMIDGDVEEGMVDGHDKSAPDLIGLLSGSRIVVDSLSTILLRDGLSPAMAFFHQAKHEVAVRKANVLLLMYSDIHKPVEEITIMRTADVFMELKEAVFMNEIERQLLVHKVKNMPVPRRLIPFNITEKGIELSTTSRVV